MELAVSPTMPGASVGDMASLCLWAEETGYRSAWLSEVAGPDAFVAATAIAGATTRLALGIAVVSAYTRTPATLAMAAASVSQALHGRPFRLGIGSSSETIVSGWNGVPFTYPLARVKETVEAVRAGLRGDGQYRGSQVSMTRFRLATTPLGQVELWVAALSPRMLAVAGSAADGVCLNMMPPRVVVKQLAALGSVANGFGVMARLHVAITNDLPVVRNFLRKNLLAGYLAQPVYNRFLAWMGYEDEAAAIARGWATGNRGEVDHALHDRLVDDLMVIGSEEEVRSKLAEYEEAGIQVAALNVVTQDRNMLEHTLRRLAAS